MLLGMANWYNSHQTKMEIDELWKLSLQLVHLQPEENGYLGRRPELEAVAWGQTLIEAKKELLEAIIDTAFVLIEQSNEADFQIDPRLKYAEVVASCRTKRQIKELLGL
jgi:hypothetical protein